ncbi:MAG: DNA repair protein RecN [Christensenellales bacterium]|jgi:DNA repair protein RecN (Recombination protein N)
MLNQLVIKNIALINELSVDLSDGMNVLSGETGAGKSIIIDSVNLVLGERADREMIRTGESKAMVEAWFSDIPASVNEILSGQEIEPEQDIVLSRELSASGKNVCRINGALVTLAVLKQVGDLLVDIHGQHEHQSLFNEKNHIALLDGFDIRITNAKADVKTAYKEYTAVSSRLLSLFGAEGDRERKIDILQFQINEIRQANIIEGEEDDLLTQKKRLNAAEKIMNVLGSAYDSLYRSEAANVLAALKDISSRFQSIAYIDKNYEDIAGQISEAYYALEDIASQIRGEMDMCNFDSVTLEEIEERLSLIGSLKRKYSDAYVTGMFLKNAEQELNDLVDSERLVRELSEKAGRLKSDLYNKSVRLSQIRRDTASKFESKMMEQLEDLGMSSARFSINFEEVKSIDDCEFSTNGIDEASFYISTNRGEPQKPMKKIVSGGEVSRIMLALKNIAADKGGIPTMIFDEIDTGISGRMAQVVAEKLYNISKSRQVICVTHLPQIASMADKHFLVSKESDENATKTLLQPLSKQDRISEIARLSGGDSNVAKEHAKEMLKISKDIKTSI